MREVNGREYSVSLPWPPSINTYWRRVGERTLLSRKGREYRRACGLIVGSVLGEIYPMTERLTIAIVAHQPDLRVRDLDNLLKAPLDALEHAGVYMSDSQIDDLRITRAMDRDYPRLDITITEAWP